MKKYALVSKKWDIHADKIVCIFNNARQREKCEFRAIKRYIDLVSEFEDLAYTELEFTPILAKEAKKIMRNANVVFNFTIDVNENTSIKEWYINEYIGDDLGHEIPSDLTFKDVYYSLDARKGIYSLLGNAADSLIRNRIFEKLAELMHVKYDYIYDQWTICEQG